MDLNFELGASLTVPYSALHPSLLSRSWPLASMDNALDLQEIPEGIVLCRELEPSHALLASRFLFVYAVLRAT